MFIFPDFGGQTNSGSYFEDEKSSKGNCTKTMLFFIIKWLSIFY